MIKRVLAASVGIVLLTSLLMGCTGDEERPTATERPKPTPTAAEVTSVPTLSSAEITSVAATRQAYRQTPTPGQAPGDTSGLVNATQAPDRAPVIVNFFASDVPESEQVRFNLNWDTRNATRVEIFGRVMDNPARGSWPIYADSDEWVLWAANDAAWVEAFLRVQPDGESGSTLSDASVSQRNVTLAVKDPQFVDSDNINLLVSGQAVLQNKTVDGRFTSVPVTLQSGPNRIEVYVVDEGSTPRTVVAIQISDISSGAAYQVSRALRVGETESLTLTAP
jgi:hypothetical protein